MINEDLKYKIALSLIPKVGHVIAKKLVSHVGSFEGVFKETKKKLLTIPGIGEVLAESITNSEALSKADEELKFIEKHNITTCFYLDKEYPERLKYCEDAPILIYSKGNADYNNRKVLSIVGTRKATHQGIAFCEKLIEDLAQRNHSPLIVSGLAYGIDAAAHKSALNNKLQTIAVLGHGLDIIYPASHKSLAKDIIKNGSLITDFPSKSIRDKNHFIKRNRIIAGLSDATIVIESGEKGGSLVTADIANSYNRDVFALPGRVTDQYSVGCNNLIKMNKAVLLTSVKDIEYLLGWDVTENKEQSVQRNLFVDITNEERVIVDILSKSDNVPIDVLCVKCNMPTSKVSPLLLSLEFKGLVRPLPGKLYQLISLI